MRLIVRQIAVTPFLVVTQKWKMTVTPLLVVTLMVVTVRDTTLRVTTDTDYTEKGATIIKNNINTYIAAPNLNPNPEPLLVKYPMDYLENLFGANDLIQMGVASDEVELVMEILFDTINTTKKTIWVNREEKAAEVVRSRLLKLSSFDIKYAIEQYSKQTGEIKYQKAYMLSILYDAKGQSSLDFTNRVQHDFYGGD